MRGAGRRLLQLVEEARRDEHAGERHAQRGVVRQLLRAELAVERAQFVPVRARERATPRVLGEVHDRFQLLRLGGDEFRAEDGGALLDGLAHRREGARVRVLRGELPELLEGIHELERAVADEVQLRPEPLQLGGLRVVEQQAAELVILAVVERQRHHLVHGDYLRVAQRGGEKLAELVERGLDAFARRAAVGHQNGRVRPDGPLAIGPGALAAELLRRARREAGGARRLRREHLHLHAALRAGLAVQGGRGDELTALDEIRGQAHFDERGRADAEVGGRERGAVRVLAEERGVEAGRITNCELRIANVRCGNVGGIRELALEERAAEGGELPVQHRVRRVLRQAGDACLQELLHFVGEATLLGRVGGRAPLGQHRAGGNHRVRAAAAVRLAVEMPDARVAQEVRVRVAGEDVRRDVAGKVPLLAVAGLDVQVHRCHVARVVAVARADDDGEQVARLHGEVLQRPDFYFLRTLRVASREALACVAAPEFHGPRDAVAALGVRVLHNHLDAHGGADRAAPTGRHAPLRRRVHRDAVRLHVAGDAHGLAARIRQHAQGICARPALDEVVVLRALGLHRHVRIHAHRPAADAEIIQPRDEQPRLDTVLRRELVNSGFIRQRAGFRSGGKALRRAGRDALALRLEGEHGVAHVAQAQVGPARGDEARVLPNGEVVLVAVTGVGREEVERDLVAIR